MVDLRAIRCCGAASLACLLGVLCPQYLSAEAHKLTLAVMKIKKPNPPVQNAVIAIEGRDDTRQFTGPLGEARLSLPLGTEPGMLVTVKLVRSPEGEDLMIISPLNGLMRVPPFEERPENHERVFLAPIGGVAVLEYGPGILAVHDRINRKYAATRKKRKSSLFRLDQNPLTVAEGLGQPRLLEASFEYSSTTQKLEMSDEEDYKVAVKETARDFGLSPEAVTKAIEGWGADRLTWKVVALSASLEGKDLFSTTSDVGGRDVEFGLALWSLRVCTLQPVLLAFRAKDSKLFDSIIGTDSEWLTKEIEAPCKVLTSARLMIDKMRDESGRMSAEWKSKFDALGKEPSFQRVQVERLSPIVDLAKKNAAEFGLQSERAVAFLYDLILTRGLVAVHKLQNEDQADITAFSQAVHRQPDEQERLLMFANRSAKQVPSNFANYVRPRAVMIASGGGSLFGHQYDLAAMGIGLRSFRTGNPVSVQDDRTILNKLKEGWLP